MTDADELGKLAAMHAAGSLTDDEFTAAKARLLSDAARIEAPAPRQSHRGRWVVVSGIIALIGLGATAAVVASRSGSTSKGASTQPDTQPTTGPTTRPTVSHPPLILAPTTTRPEPTPSTLNPRQKAMDTYVSIQRGYDQVMATLDAPLNGKTMTSEQFVNYCSLRAEPYASRAASLRDVSWPTYADTQVSKLADYYEIISGFYTDCSTTDPTSSKMWVLNREYQQLVADLVVLEADAAAAVGWTACADGPPPCYP